MTRPPARLRAALLMITAVIGLLTLFLAGRVDGPTPARRLVRRS